LSKVEIVQKSGLSNYGFSGTVAPIGIGFWGFRYGEWRSESHHTPL